MKNLILVDNRHAYFLPLTFTKPCSQLRVGVLRIQEKWKQYLDCEVSNLTIPYLSEKYPCQIKDNNILVNGSACPSKTLIEEIQALKEGEAIYKGDYWIAARLNKNSVEQLDINNLSFSTSRQTQSTCLTVQHPWDIFSLNGTAIQEDFQLLTQGRTSAKLSDTNKLFGEHPIFIEEGASVECAIFNTSNGPIYIGKNATVMEGSIVRGPFALCEGAVLKMGAKIYGPTTIGNYSKVGGEVNNSVFTGYSNKGHDGFLGNSVIGEWCNLGADTNNSNLKNNYAEVRLWNYQSEGFAKTGLQFCGLIMGDHSKCGINTMFNTGTVVGVSANIFGSGFPRNFIPSFSWGGASGFSTYRLNKVFDVAERVMARRGKSLDGVDKKILEEVLEQTSKHRRWDKKAV